jgi:hypothetical protein
MKNDEHAGKLPYIEAHKQGLQLNEALIEP